MVVVIVRGGLGNQLFQVAAGMYLVARSGHSLRIDSKYLRIDGDQRHYEIPSLRFRLSEASWILHLVTRLARRVFYRGRRRVVLSHNLLWTFLPDPEDGTRDVLGEAPLAPFVIIDGYWQAYRYADGFIQDFRDAVVPRGKVTDVAQKLIEQTRVRVVAALHVRRGDYVHDPKTHAVHGSCGIDYYERAIQCLDERVHVDSIYVFSDDIEWVKRNMNIGSRALFVNEDRAMSDAEDLYVMTQCRHFIIANSSFSWWGARLGTAPDKVVIAPRQWLSIPNRLQEGLIPPGWVLV